MSRLPEEPTPAHTSACWWDHRSARWQCPPRCGLSAQSESGDPAGVRPVPAGTRAGGLSVLMSAHGSAQRQRARHRHPADR